MDDFRERFVPLGLFVMAFAGATAGHFAFADGGGLLANLGVFTVTMGFVVMLGIVACFISASLLDIGFGELGPATLKLAGILSFSMVAAAYIPIGIVGLFAFWMCNYILQMWLFDLESRDAMISSAIVLVVMLVAPLLVGSVVALLGG